MNSAGHLATLTAVGSDVAAENRIDVTAEGLPGGATLLLLTSMETGLIPGVGGGQGQLCLGGAIGRFLRPGELRFADATGVASLPLDLSSLPTPIRFRAALAGETWYFQGWYRDAIPQPTSNLTNRLGVLLR